MKLVSVCVLDRLCIGTREPNQRDFSRRGRHIQGMVVCVVLDIFRHYLVFCFKTGFWYLQTLFIVLLFIVSNILVLFILF